MKFVPRGGKIQVSGGFYYALVGMKYSTLKSVEHFEFIEASNCIIVKYYRRAYLCALLSPRFRKRAKLT